MPKTAYFHGSGVLVKLESPPKIMRRWEAMMMINATKVMVLGAIVSGVNFRRNSPKGDQRYL